MLKRSRLIQSPASIVVLASAMIASCAQSSSGALTSADEAVKNQKPNIVLIMADDLGYGDLSSYGHPNIVTPNIDALAEQNLKLTSFYAGEPVCTPSRAALLTGKYAIRTDMTGVEFPNSDHGLPPAETTLPEALKEQGYATAMVGKWHLGDQSPYLPTEHGFDDYYGLLYSNDMIEPWISTDMEEVDETPPPLVLVRGTEPDQIVDDQAILTQTYTREAVTQVNALSGDDPFFLYLAYSMPHLPVAAPASKIGSSEGGLYGDVIETIDWSVGEVLKALKENGELENTIVVFTSDNGPWHNLPDRMVVGGVERWHVGSAGALRGSKGTTYEGGLRVPAIIHWPNAPKGGRVSSEMVSAMDLFSTLAAAGGASLDGDDTIDGRDLSNFFAGRTAEVSDGEFFYFRGERLEAIRDDVWKLRIARFTETNNKIADDADPIVELFNLADDPSERFDVSAEYPEQVMRLRARLIEFGEETNADLAFTE